MTIRTPKLVQFPALTKVRQQLNTLTNHQTNSLKKAKIPKVPED